MVIQTVAIDPQGNKLHSAPKELTVKPGRQVIINMSVRMMPLINNNNKSLSFYYGLGTVKCFDMDVFLNSHKILRRQMFCSSER